MLDDKNCCRASTETPPMGADLSAAISITNVKIEVGFLFLISTRAKIQDISGGTIVHFELQQIVFCSQMRKKTSGRLELTQRAGRELSQKSMETKPLPFCSRDNDQGGFDLKSLHPALPGTTMSIFHMPDNKEILCYADC